MIPKIRFFIELKKWPTPMALLLHPWKFKWNLKITPLKRKIIFQISILWFHVNFRGCKGTVFFWKMVFSWGLFWLNKPYHNLFSAIKCWETQQKHQQIYCMSWKPNTPWKSQRIFFELFLPQRHPGFRNRFILKNSQNRLILLYVGNDFQDEDLSPCQALKASPQ